MMGQRQGRLGRNRNLFDQGMGDGEANYGVAGQFSATSLPPLLDAGNRETRQERGEPILSYSESCGCYARVIFRHKLSYKHSLLNTSTYP